MKKEEGQITTESAPVVPVLNHVGYANWTDNLERSKKGIVLQTISNCVYALENCPQLAGILQYNEFTGKVEIVNQEWKRFDVYISDLDEDYIRLILEKGGLKDKTNIRSALNIVAHERCYHPVREFLEKVKCDHKQNYLADLFPVFLGAERSPYTTIVTKILFSGIIRRMYKPGAKHDTCLVLMDEKQGAGKSTMCRLLATRDEWFTDSLKDMSDTEGIVETLAGHLICELPEMETVASAKNIETIRSFLSRQAETYRVPWDRYPHDFMRQTVFIGTSNDPNFLPPDPAGNRRFHPLKCDGSKAECHPLKDEAFTRKFIENAYGQAMELFREDKLPETLTTEWEGKLIEIQEDFTPEDVTVGLVRAWLDDKQPERVCTMMIYCEALGNVGKPKQWESKELTRLMNRFPDYKQGGTYRFKESDSHGDFPKAYGPQKSWVRVEDVTDNVTGSVTDSVTGLKNSDFVTAKITKTPFDCNWT